MSTQTVEQTAEVKPAANIAEADVVAWLNAAVARAEIPGLGVGAFSGGRFTASGWIDGEYACEGGETVGEAIAAFARKAKPLCRAEAKREMAARLLAEADALVGGKEAA
jgi:hypothetical protein